MIIKFFERDATIIYGEIDHVSYGEFKDGQLMSEENFIKYDPGIEQGKRIGMKFFSKYMTAPTRVLCYSPVYLMNDNGKTIEVI